MVPNGKKLCISSAVPIPRRRQITHIIIHILKHNIRNIAIRACRIAQTRAIMQILHPHIISTVRLPHTPHAPRSEHTPVSTSNKSTPSSFALFFIPLVKLTKSPQSAP